MVDYGGDSGAGGQADGEPFCGSLEALQDGSAVGGGLAASRSCCKAAERVLSSARSIFEGVVLDGAGATVLEIIVERDQVGLRDGNGGQRRFAWWEGRREIGV